jgi:hypothetical protein
MEKICYSEIHGGNERRHRYSGVGVSCITGIPAKAGITIFCQERPTKE